MARILIVDDEPEIVRGLEDNLRFEGYQTLTAGNGADALAVAAREAPDLIVLDEVWGYERFPTTRTVDTHVLRLRRKFEADPEHPRFILTVHGQGYRFAGS